MKEVLNGFKLILGSSSPRRKHILEEADIPFTVRVMQVEETYPDDILPQSVPAYLARKKAEAHTNLARNEILLTADSVVIHENTILEKPNNFNEAYHMISTLSGSQHEVTTALCLRYLKKTQVESVTSKVWFNEMKESEIEYYVNNYQPFDKAGGYGIQEWIGHTMVSRIEGSYLNIVGLPMEAVYRQLSRLVFLLSAKK